MRNFGHGKRCQFRKDSIWEILVLGKGNAVSSERIQSGKFGYWARETLSVRKGLNLGNLVLGTGNAVSSERVRSGKFFGEMYRFRYQCPSHFSKSFSRNCLLSLLSLYICVGLGNHRRQYEFWYVFCNPGYRNVYLFDPGDPENREACPDRYVL